MKTSQKGIELLKHYEGCRLTAYLDSVRVPTIGFGNTFYEDGRKVKMGDSISQKRADELLKVILSKFELAVSKMTDKIHLFPCQFDALVCFAYNVGLGALGVSTLLKKVLKCPNDETIKDEFLKWNKAGGKVVRGLTFRRQSEAHLYFNNEVKFYN